MISNVNWMDKEDALSGLHYASAVLKRGTELAMSKGGHEGLCEHERNACYTAVKLERDFVKALFHSNWTPEGWRKMTGAFHHYYRMVSDWDNAKTATNF